MAFNQSVTGSNPVGLTKFLGVCEQERHENKAF